MMTDAGSDASFSFTADTSELALGTIEDLMRANSLEPDQWCVVSTTLNTWTSVTKESELINHSQVKVNLRRAPSLIFPAAATHVPRIRQVPLKPSKAPRTVAIFSDHQCPFYSKPLHTAALSALDYLKRQCNLTEVIHTGDLCDFNDISRHPDTPDMATVNQSLQSGYDVLRDIREVVPNVRMRMLLGNHEHRCVAYMLKNASRMAGVKIAGTDVPALSLSHLLNLDAMSIELVESPLQWSNAEIELTPNLVVRHGHLTGANTARKTLEKRGKSIVVSHTHQRESVYWYNPTTSTEFQAAVCGTMSLAHNNEEFPDYAPMNAWLQGFVVATIHDDTHFVLDHAHWDDTTGTLYWRDQMWSA